jgi:serine/threonine protein kinase
MEKYRLEGKLGTVHNIFRATRIADGAGLIMKRVTLSHLDEDGVQQAHMEMGLARKLQHPHVVKCEDTFQFGNDDLCILFRYYSRGDLSSFIARKVRSRDPFLDENLVMRWFINLALALHYLHSHNIVHRDLKASNIFLEGSAELDAPQGVVLGDFGIAQLVRPNDPSSSQRSPRTAAVSGTPQYMAPELLQAGNAHSFRSDVWSLGCILYEMLCYRHPFEARDVSGLVVKVIQGNFQPLPQRYSREVCELVVRLLDVNPSTRPNIDEVLTTPFVMSHLRRYLASVNARGAQAYMTQQERRNFNGQMTVLGASAASPPQPMSGLPELLPPGHLRKPTLSPDRAYSQISGSNAGGSPRVPDSEVGSTPAYGRRSGVPQAQRSPTLLPPSTSNHLDAPRSTGRGSVASSHAVSTVSAVQRQRGSPNGYVSSPTSDTLSIGGGTGSSGGPRNAHELALYEAAREHDVAYQRLKEAQRRGVHGMGTASVKDTVDRILYGPPAHRAVRDTPAPRDSNAGIAGFFT